MTVCFNPNQKIVHKNEGEFCSCGWPLQLLDRYSALSPLGLGTFGSTFLSRDSTTQGLVAIKVVNPELMQRAEENSSAPASEYQVLKELTSELPSGIRIPRALDIFEFEDYVFIVQEFIRGTSLEQQEPLTENEAIRLLWMLLKAANYIHSYGYIHRDIKPANIVLQPELGLFYLVDFGGARKIDRNTVTTYGCPAFAAPEQMRGRGVSYKADVYGIGATVVYALTHLTPYDYMFGISENWNVNKVVSPELEKLISGAIVADSRQRPSTGDLLRRMADLLGEEPPPIRGRSFAKTMTAYTDAIADALSRRILEHFGLY